MNRRSLVLLGLGAFTLAAIPHVIISLSFPWARPGTEYAVLPGFLCIPGGVLVLPLLAFPRTRQPACIAAIGIWSLIFGTFAGMAMDVRIRMNGFARAASLAEPLVEAINRFEVDHGRPPSDLNEVIPGYIPAMPTGLPPLDLVTGEKARKEFQGNEWALVANVPIGFFNWDIYFYLPLQNYPEEGYGGWVQRVGDWAYVNE